MKSIQVDGDVFSFLTAHGMGAGRSASDVLRSLLLHTIEIDDELYGYLTTLGASPDETVNSILRRELDIQEHHTEPDSPLASRIEFHIPVGTGPGPWNTREQAVSGVVGQTLRILNDDTQPHRPHASGIPFPHADSDIAPGGFNDFVLRGPISLDEAGVYDHNFGTTARFWISVRSAA